MEKKNMPFSLLVTEATELLHRLCVTDCYTKQILSLWQKVEEFMQERNLSEYTEEVQQQFLSTQNKAVCKKAYMIKYLLEFKETRYFRLLAKTPRLPLSGELEDLVLDFSAFRLSHNITEKEVKKQKVHLVIFGHFLKHKGIKDLQTIQPATFVDFVKHISSFPINLKIKICSIIKAFFRFLLNNGIIKIDYSYILPKFNLVKQPRLPSVYSPTEIELIATQIDRGSPIGKRNYAMFLLAFRLGLRDSDICQLKKENLLWEEEKIVFCQKKTGVKVDLPLLPDIGNAIIDYYKYARPKANSPFVFLKQNAPHEEFKQGCLHNFIPQYIAKAGFCKCERRNGPHALRHSLATNLLEKEVPLPVISGILGHTSSTSTMYYLRVDIKSLSHCALEVPTVSPLVYERKIYG